MVPLAGRAQADCVEEREKTSKEERRSETRRLTTLDFAG